MFWSDPIRAQMADWRSLNAYTTLEAAQITTSKYSEGKQVNSSGQLKAWQFKYNEFEFSLSRILPITD